jgi:hypothetical protein
LVQEQETELIEELEDAWPLQVRFRDGDGRLIDEPEVLYGQ